jgi:hypothetical protein
MHQSVRAFVASGSVLLLVACNQDVTSPAADVPVAGPNFAVTYNPADGKGFVGKGDVQLGFGWSNKQLQANASGVAFRHLTTTTIENSWECLNTNNDRTTERSTDQVATTRGVVSAITRDKNQVTGFNLTGFGAFGNTSNTSQGPALWSCAGDAILVEGSKVTSQPIVEVKLNAIYGDVSVQLFP